MKSSLLFHIFIKHNSTYVKIQAIFIECYAKPKKKKNQIITYDLDIMNAIVTILGVLPPFNTNILVTKKEI